jgi:hypothetical protein
MQIEFIGCTGAGKSSLARGTLLAGGQRRIEISMADDYVLRRWGLHRLKSRLARTLAIDLLSLVACAASGRNNLAFLRFAFGLLHRLPIGRFQKANIARNVAKRVGVHALIRRYRRGGEIVLVDEGTLQSVHYLFVHLVAVAPVQDLARFAALVPLPDVVVYVREDERVLRERTLRRGHARIPDRSREAVGLFVERAVAAFETLWRDALRAREIRVVERRPGVVIGARGRDVTVQRAVELVNAGIEARYCSDARGPSGFSAGALSRRLARRLWRARRER